MSIENWEGFPFDNLTQDATTMRTFFLFAALILGSITIHASETDTYDFSWLDPDKKVYVLQNRKFRKVNKFHINAGYGFTTSGAFVDATSLQGRIGYFFKEEIGFEFIYAMNSGKENETASSVRNSGVSSGSVPFRRIVNNYMGGMVLWSPFYSKINTFNKIVYMDWIFGLGMAKIEEENNRKELELSSDKTLTTETHTGLMWNAGAKFYLDERWSIRLDLTTIHYQAKEAKANNPADIWYTNYDLALSLSASF